MNINKIFPEEFLLSGEQYGFNKDAKLLVDSTHTKFIGSTIEFNLPKDYTKVVPIGIDKRESETYVLYSIPAKEEGYQKKIFKDIKETLTKLSSQDSYASNDFGDLEAKISLLKDSEWRKKANSISILEKQDTLIRHIIKNPEIYVAPEDKWPWPVVYVGKKRVIVCAPKVF